MRLRLLNLAYLAVAMIATSWVLIDLFSAGILDAVKGTASFEGTFAALLNIPILAGILFLLFTLYNSPARIKNHKRKKNKGCKKTARNAEVTSQKNISKKQSRKHRSSRVKAAQDPQADYGSGLSNDSTILFQESTTIDIDDFFENTPEDTDHREYSDEGQPFDFSSESSSESLEPLAEAAVLAQFGRYDEAVETLLDEFDSNDGNCDEVATKTLEYLNKELDMESTSSARAELLESKLSETVVMFSKERAKLSDKTWQKIQLENSVHTGNHGDDDSENVILMNVR